MTTGGPLAAQDRFSRRFTAAEVALLAVVGLGLLHHTDHVLRVDHSGWPFKNEFTPFTLSLLVYPVALIVLRARSRPWLRVALVAVVFVAVQAAHVFVEQPGDQYGVWATGVSAEEESLGEPARAASEVDGVAPRGSGARSKGVQADADVDGSTAALALRLGVACPRPVGRVTSEVRARVAARVQELTGVVVSTVRVSVDELPAGPVRGGPRRASPERRGR